MRFILKNHDFDSMRQNAYHPRRGITAREQNGSQNRDYGRQQACVHQTADTALQEPGLAQ